MNDESKRIIVYDNRVYELSEEQYEILLEIKEEAKNLPFAGDLHVEEHLNFNIVQYICLGEIDFDLDELNLNISELKTLDLTGPVKTNRINPLSNLLDDFIDGKLNEDEFNEVITIFDNIKKQYKLK